MLAYKYTHSHVHMHAHKHMYHLLASLPQLYKEGIKKKYHLKEKLVFKRLSTQMPIDNIRDLDMSLMPKHASGFYFL